MRIHRITNFNAISDPAPAGTPSNVDEAKLCIYNVSVASAGEAKGHGMWIGEEFLQELTKLGNQAGKVKCHLSHFNDCVNADPLETQVGYMSNFRYIKGKCIADLYFIETEKDRQSIQKIITYAKSEPQFLGISIVFSQKTNPNPAPSEEDEYEEDYYQSYPDPEGKGRHFCTIQALYAADVVGDPALGSNLFSSDFFTQASYAAEKLNRIKSLNKPLYDRIEAFAVKFFNPPQENKTSDPPAPKRLTKQNLKSKKHIKTKNMSKLKLHAALLTAFACACETKGFGEAKGQDGTVYRYPGDTPTVGDVLTYVDAEGNEQVASDGEHVMEDGTVVIVSDGIISEVITAETPQEAMSIKKYEAVLLSLQNKIKQQEKQIAELLKEQKNAEEAEKAMNEYEVAQKRFQAIQNQFKKDVQNNNTTPAKITVGKSGEQKATFALYKAFKKSGGNLHAIDGVDGLRVKREQGENKVANMYNNRHRLSAILSPESDRACIAFAQEVFQYMYNVDPVFSTTKRIELPYSITGTQSIDLPKMEIRPIDPETDILTSNNLKSCNNNEDRVEVVADARRMKICGTQTALHICPQNFRYLFDNTVYAGAEEMPAEAVIMALLMNRVEREMARMLFGKNGITGSWCDGLFDVVEDDITDTLFPSGNVLEYGTDIPAFTTSNVVANLILLANKVPYNVRTKARDTGTTVNMWLPYNIFEMFLDELGKEDSARAKSFLDKCCNGGWAMTDANDVFFPMAKAFPLKLVPLEVFNNLPTAPDKLPIVLGLENEVFTGRYDVENIPMPRIAYDGATDKLIARMDYAGGVHYIEPRNIIIAKDAALV
jgi:hypothetical protein